MASLSELYQNVILEHNRSPRNYRTMPDANREAQGHNPLCGDHLSIHATLEDGVVKDVGFEGHGCAISKASASLMTEAIKGRSTAEADALFRDFKPVVVEECVGTTLPHLHGPAIEMISVGWGQVNALEQTLAELRTFPAVAAAAGRVG